MAANGGKVSPGIATNCDKLIVAVCRLLLRLPGAHFFLPDSVGDGVSLKLNSFPFQKAPEITFD